MFAGHSFGRRALVPAVGALVLGLSAGGARAEVAADADGEAPPDLTASASVSASAGAFLPMTLPARTDAQRAAVIATSGYDGARRSATMMTAADVTVWGPVALRGGFTYLPSTGDEKFQPHVGLRVQLLRQGRHGVDGSVGVFYRMERFTQDEGMVQVMGAVARQFDRLGLFANLSYGQDPEGDDRDGELRAAALYAAGAHVQVGLDARGRVDLFSNDQRRGARGETDYDFAGGPMACLTVGRLAFIGQAGVSGFGAADGLHAGALATVGAGGAF